MSFTTEERITSIETKLSDIDATLLSIAELLSRTSTTDGFVGNKLGFTVQVRQFEPVVFQSWGQLPCTPETKAEVFEELSTFLQEVTSKIKTQVEAAKRGKVTLGEIS